MASKKNLIKLQDIYDSKETLVQRKNRTNQIIIKLRELYPNAACSLNFKTAHQIMVAAILAAQCTDERVNKVTPELFAKYPDVYAFANADQSELEQMVKSTGFFRNKTKNIIESARQIVADFNGEVPDNMDDLLKLAGIGRKTANLVIGEIFKKPAVIVDTHVRRVSGRLGLTLSTDPDKIEQDLWQLLPPEQSLSFNHLIVYHGRAVCKAPNPKCEICEITHLCNYWDKVVKGN